jgi:hypothetical protein
MKPPPPPPKKKKKQKKNKNYSKYYVIERWPANESSLCYLFRICYKNQRQKMLAFLGNSNVVWNWVVDTKNPLSLVKQSILSNTSNHDCNGVI